MDRGIFEDLFVLEMTNNHLGRLDRGLEIVKQFSRIVRLNHVRAAIKLQFRDVANFIHKDFKARTDIRYIKRIQETELSDEDYGIIVKAIRDEGCIPLATPFDEKSVELCIQFSMPMIKVASVDSNDWLLLERIAATKKPVIVSVAGTSVEECDDLVTFFENHNIPLAINHCVAVYPTKTCELELNQIEYLRNRYPNHVIGISSHEVNDNQDYLHAMYISVAKGCKLFERHIDIDTDGVKISPYSFKPDQIDAWFKAHKRAVEMCGGSALVRKVPMKKETDFLDNYCRGVYAKRDLPAGYQLSNESFENDVYLAIPLQKGQVSSRQLKNNVRIVKSIKKDHPIIIDDNIDNAYAASDEL